MSNINQFCRLHCNIIIITVSTLHSSLSKIDNSTQLLLPPPLSLSLWSFWTKLIMLPPLKYYMYFILYITTGILFHFILFMVTIENYLFYLFCYSAILQENVIVHSIWILEYSMYNVLCTMSITLSITFVCL